jgi:uncharacterized protein
MSAPRLTFEEVDNPMPLDVDVPTLLETRLLVQGSSGSGKTWLLFDILQQLYGLIQQLVVDKEGQFARLRAKYDYLLIGPDGEIPIDFSKGAIELLLRKVLEMQVNAIWDLSDLTPHQQKEYVARLATAAAHLSGRSGLWDQMRLFVLDEAQFFAPQGGSNKDNPSLQALIELTSLGRKRGFAPIMATQRVEKLNKDISDLLENRLIGRSGTSSAVAAAKLLDFDKHGRKNLSGMETGTWYAYGPALSDDPVSITSRDTLPIAPRKRGEILLPPPTPKGIKGVVEACASFQREKEEVAHSLEDLQHQNAELKKRLRALEKAGPVRTGSITEQKVQSDPKAIERAVKDVERQCQDRIDGISRSLRSVESQLRGQIKTLHGKLDVVVKHAGKIVEVSAYEQTEVPGVTAQAPSRITLSSRNGSAAKHSRIIPDDSGNSRNLSGKEREFLDALAWYESIGNPQPRREQIAGAIGVSIKKSTWRGILAALRAQGLVDDLTGNCFALTDAGRVLANAPDEPPTLSAFHNRIREKLSGSAQRVFDHLVLNYPDALTRDELAAVAGTSKELSTYRGIMAELRGDDLVDEPKKDEIRAADWLFPEGLE